jgi:hypothetical protein
MTESVDRALKGEPTVSRPFHQWARMFFEHWGGEPMPNEEHVSALYLRERGMTIGSVMDFHQALRAFGVQSVRYPNLEAGKRFMLDYDKVHPELLDPGLSEGDYIRMEEQVKWFGDVEDKHEVVFDMGRGKGTEDRELPRHVPDDSIEGERIEPGKEYNVDVPKELLE